MKNGLNLDQEHKDSSAETTPDQEPKRRDKLTRRQLGNVWWNHWMVLLTIIAFLFRIQLLLLPRIETRKTTHILKSKTQSTKSFYSPKTQKQLEELISNAARIKDSNSNPITTRSKETASRISPNLSVPKKFQYSRTFPPDRVGEKTKEPNREKEKVEEPKQYRNRNKGC